MRLFIAICVCRVLYFIGRLIGKGTSKPGDIARIICPKVLNRLKFSGKVICITGTNGKTTTSNMVTHILRENGFSVINNSFGSNMLGGITTSLLTNCTFGGEVKADFSVLEIDERWLRFFVKEVTPDYVLLTNLLRDQIVRNCCPEIVLEKIKLGVTPGTTYILNANDPVSQQVSWGIDNPIVWFALGENERSTRECRSGTNDAKVCPKCMHNLSYNYYHYNHVGDFRCENCGFECPKADYIGTDMNFEEASLNINGKPVKLTFDATYFMFNAVAATALCCSASGISTEKALAAAETFDIGVIKRYEEIEVLGRKCQLILTKQNPASIDQSVDFVADKEAPRTLIIISNNMFHTERKDVLFMYDVAYENLKEVEHIVIVGKRRYDMAVRLKLADIDMERVQICDREEDLRSCLEKTEGNIYVMTSSVFSNEDKVLEELKKL
ncbi:MAG: DUF1727 domain-containing protein [Oscillospiraceae bacterium]|nr:DUF1727 domain-containing protein [Oscillospiraceae bacterium]